MFISLENYQQQVGDVVSLEPSRPINTLPEGYDIENGPLHGGCPVSSVMNSLHESPLAKPFQKAQLFAHEKSHDRWHGVRTVTIPRVANTVDADSFLVLPSIVRLKCFPFSGGLN
jgi:hypothetical protein